jgi:hypothetical protein
VDEREVAIGPDNILDQLDGIAERSGNASICSAKQGWRVFRQTEHVPAIIMRIGSSSFLKLQSRDGLGFLPDAGEHLYPRRRQGAADGSALRQIRAHFRKSPMIPLASQSAHPQNAAPR